MGSSESFFKGTQAIERDLLNICAIDILKGKEEEHDGYDEDEDILWKQYCEGRALDTDYGVTMPPQPRRETMEDMSHRAYDFLVDYLLKRF